MDYKNFAISSTLFAFLTTVAADVSIPNGDIPITLQSVFVLLAGLIAGANAGITSQLIYLMFGAFLPVFAGEDFGLSILADPTVGYLFAFPVAAFITGMLGHQQKLLFILLSVILAQSVLYISGVSIYYINSEKTWAEVIQIGFIDLAFIGYSKAIITGLLYFAYLKFSGNKQAVTNRK